MTVVGIARLLDAGKTVKEVGLASPTKNGSHAVWPTPI